MNSFTVHTTIDILHVFRFSPIRESYVQIYLKPQRYCFSGLVCCGDSNLFRFLILCGATSIQILTRQMNFANGLAIRTVRTGRVVCWRFFILYGGSFSIQKSDSQQLSSLVPLTNHVQDQLYGVGSPRRP
jgi:hypothetical protein